MTRSCLGRRSAGVVEPDVVVEPRALHDERVALPASDRIAKPRRIRILRQLAAVGEDLPERVNGLVEDRHQAGRLDDLERIGNEVRSRHAADDAVGGRVVFGVVGDACLEERLGPRLERHCLAGLHAARDVFDEPRRRPPESGDGRFAVRAPWRGRVQVRPAVGGARDARRRVLSATGPRPTRRRASSSAATRATGSSA